METQEQTFGQESVERSLGYVPADVPMPAPEERQGDISLQETELRDAANEITKDRNERQREVESRPVDNVVEVRDHRTDRKLPENETLTAEEASYLVTDARNKQETTVDLNERDELAREIDALRNGVTSEQFQAEPQQPLPPQDTAQLSDNERMAKALQENPQLLAGVQAAIWQEQQRAEQAHQQAAAIIQHNAHVAAAALVSNFSELQNLQPHEIGTAIQVISQRDPQRAQQIVNFIDRIAPLVNQAVRVQEQQQQRTAALYQQWQANQQAQFQQAALQHDQTYDAYANAETSSPAERKAIEAEALQLLREGGDDRQIYHAYNTNWAMRSATAQKALFDAARARLARKGAKAKLSRPVPAIQRPGSPLERASEQDYTLRSLNKGGGPLSAKEAADLVTAQRASRRR
jgi:hypothetical protein